MLLVLSGPLFAIGVSTQAPPLIVMVAFVATIAGLVLMANGSYGFLRNVETYIRFKMGFPD